MFQKATKRQARARVALVGPSGSGKTFTALMIAKGLGGRTAVIDSERGSASKYADVFGFDVAELNTFAPEKYVEAIKAAEVAGYDIVIVDSLSHAWMGKDGALEQVDNVARRSQSKNSFFAWREITPRHNALVDAMLASKCHVIVTLRTKTEYVIETDDRGKQVPKKVGTKPVQRDGLEYEFDIVADMDLENNLLVSKSRCPSLSGKVINRPTDELGKTLAAWLSDGAPPAPQPETPVPASQPQAQSQQSAAAKPANGNGASGGGNGSAQTVEQLIDAAKTMAELGKCLPLVKTAKDVEAAKARYYARKAQLTGGAS